MLTLTPEKRQKLLKQKDFLEFLIDPQMKSFKSLEILLKETKEQAETQIANEIQQLFYNALTKEAEFVQKYGREAVQEEINKFKVKTSDIIKNIFASLEHAKSKIFENTQKENREIMQSAKDEAKKILEIMRGQVEQMRGPKGEPGSPGTNGSPDMAEDIRDKLELLQNDERLEMKAIKGLEEKLKEIKETKERLGRIMGPSVITPRPLFNISTDSTPSITGAINGSNKEFTLPKAPVHDRGGNHAISVYLNGARMREGTSNDYTMAGKTLTFNTAPLTSDILTVDIFY